MHRRSSFKTPPVATSQHARRTQVLDEQKKKRAQRVDSSRNLDNFTTLSLDDEAEDTPEIRHEGVAHLASLVPSQRNDSTNGPRTGRKPNQHFANKIMYAELLEMRDDYMFAMGDDEASSGADGLPPDLTRNWVALAPVPQGKRCLAVSNQSPNIPGTVSNTFLKSRLKGHTILTFPSPLPPATILDCILDANWKSNGILHVLDIIRWKGQEIGECEAVFRFWWRDTRLSELVFLPAQFHMASSAAGGSSPTLAYPNVFLSVPYHMDLSFLTLLSTVIPLSRSARHVTIQFPSHFEQHGGSGETDMDVDHVSGMQLEPAEVEIHPDGLLLYVSQASYDSGTTPLSSWVPARSLTEGGEIPLTLFERLVKRRVTSDVPLEPESHEQ